MAFGAVWAVPGVVGLESSGRGCWIVGEVGRCDLLPRSLPGAGDVDTLDVRGVRRVEMKAAISAQWLEARQ